MVPHNKPIESCTINEIVDCIETEVYGAHPFNLISQFEGKKNNPVSNFLRVCCVPYLFHEADKIYASGDDPINKFEAVLLALANQLEEVFNNNSLSQIFNNAIESPNVAQVQHDISKATGVHYGNLFKNFSIDQYLEAKDLLDVRLKRNSVQIKNLDQAELLDQGCGGGRYTIAWKLLGAKKVVGVDISDIGIEDANRKLEYLKLTGVDFRVSSVLDLPFENDKFDIVYSNGVHHHTIDWELGLKEQLRVLKPKGFGWQYLIENPGGIFWDKIEILRAILRDVDKVYAQNVMAMLGVPMNRIFYMLDHVMVPINTRVSQEELYNVLEKNGAKEIKRLSRGTDFDRIELIHKKTPYAVEKFGVGENRFVFSK